MKKIRVLLLCMLLVLSASACTKSKNLRMGTGNVAGNYYSYGNVLANLLEKQELDYKLEIRETAGSAANLRLMKDGYVDIAIVQSDILSDALTGSGVFEGNAFTTVSSIAGLYMEQFQIVVPAASGIQSLSDLKGKRVSLGEKESGVYVVAKEVLQAAGMREDAITASYLSFSASAQALEKNEIDAFFVMAGAPTTVVTELLKTMDLRVLSLDEHTISYMVNMYDGIIATQIPANTYQGQTEDVKTIGVKAVLVANASVDKEKIKKIMEVLFSDSAEFKYGSSLMKAPSLEFAESDLPGTLHEGAKEFYNQK